ncbi:MAG: hypothetical protein LBK70_02450 [Clostridiales bacterium]|nr:hypothetical protein [Clostridiales bacterium]
MLSNQYYFPQYHYIPKLIFLPNDLVIGKYYKTCINYIWFGLDLHKKILYSPLAITQIDLQEIEIMYQYSCNC